MLKNKSDLFNRLTNFLPNTIVKYLLNAIYKWKYHSSFINCGGWASVKPVLLVENNFMIEHTRKIIFGAQTAFLLLFRSYPYPWQHPNKIQSMYRNTCVICLITRLCTYLSTIIFNKRWLLYKNKDMYQN